MSYQGDIVLGATIEWTFTTRRFSTGAPFTLAGTPSLEAYQTGSSVPITAGITLTADYSGVTGLNHISVAATGGNGFATAKDVSIVIAAGTVDSVSVVGETLGSFSIGNRSTVSDVSAIKAKTDSLNFTVAGCLDVNVLKINGVTVIGTGVSADLWRA